jgi:hypothetical protein
MPGVCFFNYFCVTLTKILGMRVSLQIKRKEFDLIKSGIKKTEWRAPSKFNKDRLFCPDKEYSGQLNGNPDISEIEFINGMKPNAPRIIVEVAKRIRMVRFGRDIELPEDNFKAQEGMFAIEISLGKIISISE